MSQIDLSALEADLEAAPPNNVGAYKCKVQALVAEHPEAADVLRRAIADVRRSNRRTADILTRNGLPISETAVKRHRAGTCTICREAASS